MSESERKCSLCQGPPDHGLHAENCIRSLAGRLRATEERVKEFGRGAVVLSDEMFRHHRELHERVAALEGAEQDVWASVERNAAAVKEWPEWKRRGAGLGLASAEAVPCDPAEDGVCEAQHECQPAPVTHEEARCPAWYTPPGGPPLPARWPCALPRGHVGKHVYAGPEDAVLDALTAAIMTAGNSDDTSQCVTIALPAVTVWDTIAGLRAEVARLRAAYDRAYQVGLEHGQKDLDTLRAAALSPEAERALAEWRALGGSHRR